MTTLTDTAPPRAATLPPVQARPDNEVRRTRFDVGYREKARLKNGRSVLVRPVRPTDSALLKQGFERLSDQSRYLRFLGPRSELTAAQLEYLTHVDGYDHFALGALERGAGEPERGLGIARFVRLSSQPDMAEAAVTVADDAQGQGLGSLLLRRLAEAAQERDIVSFRCVLLDTNAAMKRLLEQLGECSVVRRVDGTSYIDVRLATPTPTTLDAPAAPGLFRRVRAAVGRLAH